MHVTGHLPGRRHLALASFCSLVITSACGSSEDDDGREPTGLAGAAGAAGAAGSTQEPAGGSGGAGGAAPAGGAGGQPSQPPPAVVGGFAAPTVGSNVNLFTELLDIPAEQVHAKVRLAAERIFGIGTNEPATPPTTDAERATGYRLYYELPQDPSQAFIWATDSNDIRSEGMSYGMMIAVQLGMQEQFDKLWNFARQQMQFPADTTLTAWRYYFRWQGSVDSTNASNWAVNYGAETGPAPDGDEYFAAALYLADRRWGSAGTINYEEEADKIASAMLNNVAEGGRTPIIDPQSNMVVFFPLGGSATFSDPSYHLPAFYEIFAEDGPEADSARWLQVAETSRQYFVTSANATTGLHPDYANFDGTPNTGGSDHDQFRYDAWRVVMNMAVDYTWGSQDPRLKTQIEKYHSFFTGFLGAGNVTNALFAIDGSAPTGGSSTALTATLASGALVSQAPNINAFVQNAWDVGQQQGTFRYYQEMVYLLGLLATSGLYGYDWADTTELQ
jgi:oligosaccharide reducing-end xylanase